MSKKARWGLGLIGLVLAAASIALLAYALAPTAGAPEKVQVRLQPTVFQAPQP